MNKKLLVTWVAGMITGAAFGYLYYQFWGCNGSCSITSNAWKSTLYGMLLGGVAGYSGWPWKKQQHSSQPQSGYNNSD